MMCNEKINHKAPLTREEREFAEVRHNVIYSFLNKYRLAEQEYYDVAAVGYLRAVRKYLQREELRQYSFTTIAFKSMSSEYSNYKKSKIRKTSKDIYDSDDYDFSLIENIEDPSDDYDTVCERDAASEQLSGIFSIIRNNRHKMMFVLLSKGYTCEQIGQMLDISPEAAYEAIARTRELVKRRLPL